MKNPMTKPLVFIISLWFVCSWIAVGQSGTCSSPVTLSLNESWTEVTATGPEGIIYYEFTAPEFGTLEMCGQYGENSMMLLSNCNPDIPINWTDTDIECAPASATCLQPQTFKVYEMTANETVLISMLGTEDPFFCFGSVELRFYPKGDICGLPTPIHCGETVQFNTDLYSNSLSGAGDCVGSFPVLSGHDRTFLLDLGPTPQDVHLTMSSLKMDRDILGVFRTCNDCPAGCFMTDCVDVSFQSFSDETLYIPNISGQLLIVCDWAPNDNDDLLDGNTFTLSVQCDPCPKDYHIAGDDCIDATPVVCGDKITFHTADLTNEFQTYECNSQIYAYSGQERVFRLDIPSTPPSEHIISLNSNKPDQDVLAIYRECADCQAGCFLDDCYQILSGPGNQGTLINSLFSSGTFYIVCDWEPDDAADFEEGIEFTLEIFGQNCPDTILGQGNFCVDPSPVSCGDYVEFTTDQLSNEINFLEDCSFNLQLFRGGERTFILDVGIIPTDVEINMNSQKGDRDVLGIYRTCNDCFSGCFMTDCVDYAQNNAGDEQIQLTGITGQLLIVCDWEPANSADSLDGNQFGLSILCNTCAPDPVPPTITCPFNEIEVTTAFGSACETVFYPTNQASDNQGIDTIVYSMISGSCFPLGSTIVEATVYDLSGNSATCAFTITVLEEACCLGLTIEGDDLFNTFPVFPPVFGDADNDGPIDWIVIDQDQHIKYYENIQLMGHPDFAVNQGLQTINFDTPFITRSMYGYDYNQDGYMDIFALNVIDTTLLYCENDATPAGAQYTVYNTGVRFKTNSDYFSIGDLNNDGLPDLVVAVDEYTNGASVVYYEHLTGTNCTSPPCFALAANDYDSPFINTPKNGIEVPIPEIFDADCDGDMDLYLGLRGEVRLFLNNGTITNPGNLPPINGSNFISNPHGIVDLETTVEEFVTPRFVDIDQDGETELFIAEANFNMQFYENCGDQVVSTKEYADIRSPLRVYPNPATRHVSILLEEKFGLVKGIRLYNTSGIQYTNFDVHQTGSMVILDAINLGEGLYFMEITTDADEKYFSRIVITGN